MPASVPFQNGSAVFEPEAMRAMSIAFDQICQIMNLPTIANNEREAVAIRIFELARSGELNPDTLRDRILREAYV